MQKPIHAKLTETKRVINIFDNNEVLLTSVAIAKISIRSILKCDSSVRVGSTGEIFQLPSNTESEYLESGAGIYLTKDKSISTIEVTILEYVISGFLINMDGIDIDVSLGSGGSGFSLLLQH